MRVLVAPLEFKGSLTAQQAAEAIRRGLERAGRDLEVTVLPLADGGPGSVELVLAHFGGERMTCEVEDPLGRQVTASWARIPRRGGGQVAVIEMAAASGLWRLAPEERAPLRADTFGTGQLIRAALGAGVCEIIVCAGGSATNDGGSGALRALGVGLEGRGAEASLSSERVDLSAVDPRLRKVKLTVAADVASPLLGAGGATRVFGPQKGASPDDVARLERAMEKWAGLLQRATGADHRATPGAGAAGGLAFGLLALGAAVRPGFEVLSELVELERHLEACHLVITGEGRLDAQTALGKGPWRIRQAAQRLGRRTLLFVGRVAEELDPTPWGEVIQISPAGLPDEAQKRLAAGHLEEAARAWAVRA